MIDYIKGILTELNPTEAVVEAAGVGYAVAIILPGYSAMAGKEETEVKLYITEVIREDAHELYGFVTKAERQLFEMLMTVSGVGASTARMIMSAFSVDDLRTLIATGNAKAMAKVKGLGPKTAQRIIVDLKDKAIKLENLTPSLSLGEGALVPEEESPVKAEAVSALTMLGFAAAASSKTVDKILKKDPNMRVEAVIREALKML